VIFLSAEDDAEDTIIPRLMAAGADLKRVHIIESVISGRTDDGEPMEKLFSLQSDLYELDKTIREIGDVGLIVIDPVSAYLDGVDSYKNSEVRAVLAPLRTLARKHNTAVLMITHINKDGAKALMRVNGSLGFGAAARAVYLVAEDPLDPARRLLLSLKHNVSLKPSGMAYTVESATVEYAGGKLDTAKIEWDADHVKITAQEALNLTRKGTTSEALGPKERSLTELLAAEEQGLKPDQIASNLSWTKNNTYAVLHRLREKKVVVKKGAVYRLRQGTAAA
jgi:hypothetical protein